MKKLIILLLSIGFLFSCAPKKGPEDLKGLKEALQLKKKELSVIQTEVDSLKLKIEELSPKKEKKEVLVTTISAAKKDFNQYVDIQASIMSEDMVNVSSEIGGRILALPVKEGNYVKRGQLIATIDLETVEKQIAELNTSLELANTVYERQNRLWEQKIGSEMQLLQAKNNKERLEKNLELLELQRAKKNVYAPISGVVDAEYTKQGEVVAPGMPIIKILNTNKVKAVANVPESYLGKIKRGDRVDIYFPAIDKKVNEKVSLIGRSIDPDNRTFKVEIDLQNKGGLLKPNLLASVAINSLSLEDVVSVPTHLVQQEISGKDFLYVIENQGGKMAAKKVYITIGPGNNDAIVIESGLTGTETIINEGSRNVSEGTLVKLSQK